MITLKVLRGISIFAIVLSSFVTGIASAAPAAGGAASAGSAACQLALSSTDAAQLTHMTGTYLPGLSSGADCTTADASAPAQVSSTGLPISLSSPNCLIADTSRLAQMTGTYLPGTYGTGC